MVYSNIVTKPSKILFQTIEVWISETANMNCDLIMNISIIWISAQKIVINYNANMNIHEQFLVHSAKSKEYNLTIWNMPELIS